MSQTLNPPASLQGQLVVGVGILLNGLLGNGVQIIVEKSILERVELAGSKLVLISNHFLAPLLEGVQSQNVGIGNILLEVGVVHTVTCISKSDTRSVRAGSLDPRPKLRAQAHWFSQLRTPSKLFLVSGVSADNLAFRFGVRKCKASINHLLTDLGFSDLNLLALELANLKDTLIVSLLNSFHGQDTDSLFVQREGSVNQRAYHVRTNDLGNLLDGTFSGEDALVGHVACSSLSHDIVVGLINLEDTISDLGANKAASLAVHSLGAQGSSDVEDLSVLWQLTLQGLGGLGSPLKNLDLQSRVLLRTNTLTFGSVVVHTGLSILDRVDSVSLSELDLVQLLETVHLPSNESIVIRVCISCHKRSAPVNTATKVGEIFPAEGRKVLQPVLRIGKLVNLIGRDTNGLHNLKLITHLDLLSSSLSFCRLELGDVLLGLLGDGSLLNNLILLLVSCEVLAELLDLVDELVGTSLDGHTGTVETHREESTLTLQTGNTSGELNLAD
ncbi:hypothetical protein HG530_008819 [Fusarium avenaceum]|nr:hypothetical protein HG530_008819 [Fusarium avenaceum]